MLPHYFEFFCPVKILAGDNALDNMPYEVTLLGSTTPMIITDRTIAQLGTMELVKGIFRENKMTIGAIYQDVPPDSSERVVNEIARIYKDCHCDSIIAVGGGSVIDTAKGVNILVSEGSQCLSEFMGAQRLKRPLRPLIVVPTTSGTGSEATLVAVIYSEEKNVKMAFTSHFLIPNVTILDPRTTFSLPPKLTAQTAMDALSHAIESYISIQKNPISDSCAISSIRLIKSYLKDAIKDGKNREARLGLALAATLAGMAFSNSMVGVVHSLGHAAGAVSRIPHGLAMSIFLPFGMEYNLGKREKELGELLFYLGGEEVYFSNRPEDRAVAAIQEVVRLKEELKDLCGLERSLREAGVAEEDLPRIAKKAIYDPSIVFNPRDMDFEDAMAILKKAF